MNPADMDNMAKADKDELLGIIETMQTRDRCAPRPERACAVVALTCVARCAPSSLRMYNGLVERCFISCVDSFRRKTLEKNEEQARGRHACFVAPC